MGTKTDSFRAFSETCPIMEAKFKAIHKHITSFMEVLSQDDYDKLISLVDEADKADSEIRHKFRDIHIEALDLAQEWEIKHDRLNEQVEKKDDEIKELQEEVSAKMEEIESLEETVQNLEERVQSLEQENNTLHIA